LFCFGDLLDLQFPTLAFEFPAIERSWLLAILLFTRQRTAMWVQPFCTFPSSPVQSSPVQPSPYQLFSLRAAHLANKSAIGSCLRVQCRTWCAYHAPQGRQLDQCNTYFKSCWLRQASPNKDLGARGAKGRT